MSNFLKSILKDSGNEYASLAIDGLESDISGFIDTGSYAFNALLSGTIHGGMPNNKIIGIAGESATGKTYFALGIARQFLQDNVDAAVLYFDSEQAVTSDMINERGLDPKRVAVFPIATRKKMDGTLAVDYEKLCALAFAAIKELKEEIDEKVIPEGDQ